MAVLWAQMCPWQHLSTTRCTLHTTMQRPIPLRSGYLCSGSPSHVCLCCAHSALSRVQRSHLQRAAPCTTPWHCTPHHITPACPAPLAGACLPSSCVLVPVTVQLCWYRCQYSCAISMWYACAISPIHPCHIPKPLCVSVSTSTDIDLQLSHYAPYSPHRHAPGPPHHRAHDSTHLHVSSPSHKQNTP